MGLLLCDPHPDLKLHPRSPWERVTCYYAVMERPADRETTFIEKVVCYNSQEEGVHRTKGTIRGSTRVGQEAEGEGEL